MIAEDRRHHIAGLDGPRRKSLLDDLPYAFSRVAHPAQVQGYLAEMQDQQHGRKYDDIGHQGGRRRPIASHPKYADKHHVQDDVKHVHRDHEPHGEEWPSDDRKEVGDVHEQDARRDEETQHADIYVELSSQLPGASKEIAQERVEDDDEQKQQYPGHHSHSRRYGEVVVRSFRVFFTETFGKEKRSTQPRYGVDHRDHEDYRCCKIDDRKSVRTEQIGDDHAVGKFTQRHSDGGKHSRDHKPNILSVQNRACSPIFCGLHGSFRFDMLTVLTITPVPLIKKSVPAVSAFPSGGRLCRTLPPLRPSRNSPSVSGIRR